MPATVLGLTGGIDSALLLFDLVRGGLDVSAVYVDYGQVAMKRETAAIAAVLIAVEKAFKRPVPLVKVSVSTPNLGELTLPARLCTLVVPILASVAIRTKSDRLAVAARIDTTPEGFDLTVNRLIQSADPRTQVGVYWPYASKKKGEILEAAVKAGVPISATWSCFGAGDVHCGKCKGCTARRTWFQRVSLPDYTDYQA